jgi:hypothetical protein
MSDAMDMAWFYQRLFDYRQGTLDADALKRFERMLKASKECRDAMRAAEILEKVEGGTADLIPTSVLARWGEIAPMLDEAERELVREHLERSQETTKDLELVGILDAAEAMRRTAPRAGTGRKPEEPPMSAAGEAPQVAPPGTLPVPPLEELRASFRQRWFSWVTAYAAAATTLIVFLLIRAGTAGPDSDGLSSPLNIVRAAHSPPVVVAVAADAVNVIVSPAGQNIGTEHRIVTIRVVDPQNHEIHTSEARLPVGVEPRRIAVVISNPDPWTPGIHRMIIEIPATGEVLSEYLFQLRVQ